MQSERVKYLIRLVAYCLMHYNKATTREAGVFWIVVHMKANALLDGERKDEK